jgi:hypothetical protein
MTPRALFLPLLLVCLALPLAAAEEKRDADKSEKKQASDAEIKARLAEHAARRKAAAEEAAVAEKDDDKSAAIGAPVATDPAAKTEPADEKAAKASPKETPTVLPEVRVRKDRITELDQQLAKQNKEIAREKQNAKPTPLDETLNSPKLSKIFGIFGGQSSEDRSSIAQERVAMMEEERDIIEAISQAETPEEKALLQKTLDSMRAMRRELEQSLR